MTVSLESCYGLQIRRNSIFVGFKTSSRAAKMYREEVKFGCQQTFNKQDIKYIECAEYILRAGWLGYRATVCRNAVTMDIGA